MEWCSLLPGVPASSIAVTGYPVPPHVATHHGPWWIYLSTCTAEE